MKYFLAFILLITILGCEKTIEPEKKDESKTKLEHLCSEKWQIRAVLIDPPYLDNGKLITDYYLDYQDCKKDNFQKYNSDSTVIYDEGPTKCAPNAPQTRFNDWYFNTDETLLIEDGTEFKIHTLNEKELILTFDQKISGVDYLLTFKYVHP